MTPRGGEMLELRQDGDTFELMLGDGENRFRNDFFAAFEARLDEVRQRAGEGPATLVLSAEGKFWSNGIDLDWLSAATPEEQVAFTPALQHLLGRLMTFPLPVVAALNGHAFAGGAILALCADYRVMRTGRGWFCLPEIDIQIPVPPPMLAILEQRLRFDTLREALLVGRRFTAEQALAAGIVEVACGHEELLAQAVAVAAPMSQKPRAALTRFKSDLYGRLAAGLGYPATVA